MLTARSLCAEGLRVTVAERRQRTACTSPWWVEVDSASVLQQVVPHPAPGVPIRRPEAGADFFSPSVSRCVHLDPSPLYGWELGSYLEALRDELAGRGVQFLFGHEALDFQTSPRGGIRCLLNGAEGPVEVQSTLLVLATGTLDPFAHLLRNLGFVLPKRRALHVQARHESWTLEPQAAKAAAWPSTLGTSVNILAASSAFSTLGFCIRPDGKQATLLSGIVAQPGSLSPQETLSRFRAEYPGVFVQCQEAFEAPIPITRPIPQLSGKGVAIIGSAACQVSPLTGSALALTGHAALILASAAARYCRQHDPDALWHYSTAYMRSFGAVQAFAEGMSRSLIRSATGPDLAESMFKSGYINAAEMHRVLSFRPMDWNAQELPGLVKGLLRQPGLLRMAPGVMGALAAFALTHTTYPERPSAARLEAFESRLESILAGR